MTAPADSRTPRFRLPSLGNLKNQITQLPSNLYAISRIPAAEGRGRVLRTYGRILTRLAVSGVFPATTPSEERVNGFPFRVLDYTSFLSLFVEIFVRREYRFSFDSPAPVILDCGSNIGMSVLYFKMNYPACRIVAFEPDETAFRTLRENVERNHWTGVEVHNAALSEEDGEIDFFSDPSLPGSLVMSSLEQRVRGAEGKVAMRRSVQALRLSPFVTGPVDLIKMDIEGAELGVMEELARAGKLPLIQQIILEYHHHLSATENHLARLLRLLEDNGFGYQFYAPYARPFNRRDFQDMLIYTYRPA